MLHREAYPMEEGVTAIQHHIARDSYGGTYWVGEACATATLLVALEERSF